jgi:hypothetical protein
MGLEWGMVQVSWFSDVGIVDVLGVTPVAKAYSAAAQVLGRRDE